MENIKALESFLRKCEVKEFTKLADALYHYLVDKGLVDSQQDLARLLETNKTAINRMISGKNFPAKKRNERIDMVKRTLDKFKLKVVFDDKEGYAFTSKGPQENDMLEKLAVKLACNIVDVSISFNDRNRPHREIIKPVLLKKYRKTEERERIILITGAGVSHSATQGVIPLTKDAIELIRNEVVVKPDSKQNGIPQALIENELDYITLSTNLARDEFETQLMAYSKFDPVGVQRGLQEMCKPKDIPNLEYEILAHLVKNKAIDAILDFNIDELFHVKLGEEIEESSFKSIYSDGHCPDHYSELLIGRRLRRPVIIKPHGTISHSSSLRFTRDTLSKIPVKIKTLLSDLLTAKLPDAVSSEQRYLKINFIVMGFGMKSPILIESIENYLKLEPGISRGVDPHFWIFDEKTVVDEFNFLRVEKHREIFKKNSTLFPVDDKVTLPVWLKQLWRFVENSFTQEKYKVKGIERHLLVNEIFAFEADEIRELKKDGLAFWHDRTLVELYINILSSNGLLLSRRLVETRMGYYLNRYNKLEKHKKTSLTQMCGKLGLMPYKNFVSNAFTLEKPNSFYEPDMTTDIFDLLVNQLLSTKVKNRIITDVQKRSRIVEVANIIKRRNTLNLQPKYLNPHSDLFPYIRESNVLSTSLAWRYKYRQVLDSKEWQLMLAISEKGRILPKTRDQVENLFKGKRLEIILSSYDMPEEFEDFDVRRENIGCIKSSSILLSNKILTLPWWLHNQHMVIFLKRKLDHHLFDKHREKWEILNSFYYESRMLSPNVNPVMITDAKDKDELLNIYANYWYRAKVYTGQHKEDKAKPRSIPIIPDREFLNEQVELLLGSY